MCVFGSLSRIRKEISGWGGEKSWRLGLFFTANVFTSSFGRPNAKDEKDVQNVERFNGR